MNKDSKLLRILKMREESGYNGPNIDDIFARSNIRGVINSRARVVKRPRVSNPVGR